MAYKKSTITKKRIIDAAIKLFNEKGYYETSIKDIAAIANVAHPCIYYYFKNKESIAREIFSDIIEQIVSESQKSFRRESDLLLSFMIDYILVFKYIAMNKTTHAVYYDLVQYCNYDEANLNRLKASFFSSASDFFGQYGVNASEDFITAYVITSDAFAKALFKGILNGHLNFSLEEASDYFFRHMLISNLNITEEEYMVKFRKAFEICETIRIDDKL